MFMDLLAKRFAIRKYTAQQVSREDLKLIMHAAGKTGRRFEDDLGMRPRGRKEHRGA